jgi:membrane associated rhomboid family serine protease
VPWATLLLVALCCAVFAWEVALADSRSALAPYWLVPSEFLALGRRSLFLDPDLYLPFLTATFLHADLLHLLLNMVMLGAFGGPVEDGLGRLRFLGFFVLGGVVAAATHVAAHPRSIEPVVGASGAIAGVMGCFFVAHPFRRVTLLVPVRIPAFFFLVVWLAVQLLQVSDALAADGRPAGTAWWAHSGGFAYGMSIGMAWRLHRRS